MTDVVRFVPLGGLGEIGMNCMSIEHGEDVVVIDCGVLFDGRGLGVDVIHADLEHLHERKDALRALVLTHGHEDHLGAVSWFLRDFPNVPVYGPAYALALVRHRIAEHPWHKGRTLDLRTIERGARFQIGPFGFEPFQVTHSMPECMGLAIETPVGLVVHSGDFKIDDAPPEGDRFDEDRLLALGERGVRLLLSDSTNALSEGHSGGERDVAESLESLVAGATERVIVSLFASNTHRVRALFDVARRTGRKVALFGRSLDTHVRIARELGILPDPGDVLVRRETAREIPRGRLMILCTGSQGEPPAALPRLASGEHPDLALERGDLVIFSSRVIPGNERPILDLVETLARRGLRVITRAGDPTIHASGHAHRGEQRRLVELVRPRSFLPVHGTFVHLEAHAALAREAGVGDTLVALNGSIVELDEHGLRLGGHVWSGRTHIDRGGEAIDGRVIGERKTLAEGGIVVVSVRVDARGRRVGLVEVASRGVLHPEDDGELAEDLAASIERELDELRTPKDSPDDGEIREHAARAARRFFFRELGRKPPTLVLLHRER
ncbi:MAG: ribonuclease J [Sandaracinus sp.]